MTGARLVVSFSGTVAGWLSGSAGQLPGGCPVQRDSCPVASWLSGSAGQLPRPLPLLLPRSNYASGGSSPEPRGTSTVGSTIRRGGEAAPTLGRGVTAPRVADEPDPAMSFSAQPRPTLARPLRVVAQPRVRGEAQRPPVGAYQGQTGVEPAEQVRVIPGGRDHDQSVDP